MIFDIVEEYLRELEGESRPHEVKRKPYAKPINDPTGHIPLDDLCRPISARVMPISAPGKTSKGGALAIQRRAMGNKAAIGACNFQRAVRK